MFRRFAISIIAMLVMWPLVLSPPALAQHGGGGHFGGGGHYGSGGHSGYSGHYGGGGHYGGYYGGHGYSGYHYAPYSPLYSGQHYYGGHYYPYLGYGYYGHHYSPYYGHLWSGYYPYHYGLYLGPWYGYYGYGGRYYGSGYGTRAYSAYLPDSAARITTDQTTSAGLDYQRRAETSFRARDYDQAARLANHATVEMPRHGRHFLFLSQALFAVGDYRGAAAAAQQGMALADSKGWGDVVRDFRRYYTGTDYGDHLKRLEEFVAKNPDAGYARFLLGYHYGFLGYPAQAQRELSKAVELESRDEIAGRLLELFGGQRTEQSADSKRPKPEEPVTSPQTSESTNEPVEYSPPRVPAKPH